MRESVFESGTSLSLIGTADCIKVLLQKNALYLVRAARKGTLVSGGCLVGTTKPSEQVRTNNVKKMVATQVRICSFDGIDRSKRDVGSLNLTKHDGSIQRHDRPGHQPLQLIVELQNLPPICFVRGCRVTVNGIDCRLDLVRTWSIPAETVPHDALPFGDQCVIPFRAILIGQSYELTVGTNSRRASSVD